MTAINVGLTLRRAGDEHFEIGIARPWFATEAVLQAIRENVGHIATAGRLLTK